MVRKGSGWHGEPKRHSDAIKKGMKTRFQGKTGVRTVKRAVPKRIVKNNLKIEGLIHKKDAFGGDLYILNLGLVKGRNKLLNIGFKQSPNPMYLERKNEYIHYNKLLGYWLYSK